MKTGQMLFIAFGGMMLGAAGTLAIQTGLVHYEVTLDIRPRGPVTLPPPALASSADPYLDPSIGQPQPAFENTVQSWQPEPSNDLPVALPPLDEQQVAEIIAIRQQIGHPVSKQLSGLVCPADEQCESFADHLRAAAVDASSQRCPHDPVPAGPEPAGDDSVARGLKDAQPR